jgi:hypothetical protein
MTHEAHAAKALTLLIAVTERAIDAMESLVPPADGQFVAAAVRLRDVATLELRFGRLRRPPV